jgi:hypothetical protein
MLGYNASEQVRGKTIRLSWIDGPTKGTTQEHAFHKDGTVEWKSVAQPGHDKEVPAADDTAKKSEQRQYAAARITDDVCMVSYLSESGYTLTSALNFADHSIVAIASNENNWIPAQGTFEIMN